MFNDSSLNHRRAGNVTSTTTVGTERSESVRRRGTMRNRRQGVARAFTAHVATHLQCWTAPPRNHDWIAARIGRG
jgi:hypothetical protein